MGVAKGGEGYCRRGQ